MKQIISGSTLRTPTLRARTTRAVRRASRAAAACRRSASTINVPDSTRPGQVRGRRAELRMVGPGSARPRPRDTPRSTRASTRPRSSATVRSKASATARPASRTGIPAARQAASSSNACGVSAISRSRRRRADRGSSRPSSDAASTASTGQPATIQPPGPASSRDTARHAAAGRHCSEQQPPAQGQAVVPAATSRLRAPDDPESGSASRSCLAYAEATGGGRTSPRTGQRRRTRRTPSHRREPIQPGQQRIHPHRPRSIGDTPLRRSSGQGLDPQHAETGQDHAGQADSPSPAARPAASRWARRPAGSPRPTPQPGRTAITLPVARGAESSPATTARRSCSAASAAATCSRTPTSVHRSGWRPARPEPSSSRPA